MFKSSFGRVFFSCFVIITVQCSTHLQAGEWNDIVCEKPMQGFVCKAAKAMVPANILQMATNTGCSDVS